MSRVQSVSVGDDDAGMRLDRWFKRMFPNLSHGRLEKLLRTGQVRVDGKRVKSKHRLEAGQDIRVPPLDDSDLGQRRTKKQTVKIEEADIRALQDRVIYMDHHVIALNKPAGLAVQGGTKTSKHLDAMLDGLTYDAKDRPRLVHRLDKDTSGVLLLARTSVAAQKLTAAFRADQVRKIYWAVVAGVPRPRQGTINLALEKRGGGGGEKVVADEGGKKAITDYSIIENTGRKAAWLALEPHTGRTHQLRVHCAEIGTPILGDGKYGGAGAFFESDNAISRQMHLHARAVRVPNPAGGELEFIAPLPDHMVKTWKYLEFDESGQAYPFEVFEV